MPTKPTKRRNPKRPPRATPSPLPAAQCPLPASSDPPRMLDHLQCSRVLELIDSIHADLDEIRARLDRIESKRPR